VEEKTVYSQHTARLALVVVDGRFASVAKDRRNSRLVLFREGVPFLMEDLSLEHGVDGVENVLDCDAL